MDSDDVFGPSTPFKRPKKRLYGSRQRKTSLVCHNFRLTIFARDARVFTPWNSEKYAHSFDQWLSEQDQCVRTSVLRLSSSILTSPFQQRHLFSLTLISPFQKRNWCCRLIFCTPEIETLTGWKACADGAQALETPEALRECRNRVTRRALSCSTASCTRSLG